MADWFDELATGLPEFDAQHRQILLAAGRLARAIRSGGRSYWAIAEALDHLVLHCRAHFVLEEQAMRQARYPHLREHRVLHLMLEQGLAEARRAHLQGAPRELLRRVVQVGELIQAHVSEEDRRFGQWVHPTTPAGAGRPAEAQP